MLRELVAGLACGLCVAVAGAQEGSPVDALKSGPVTVWVVTPGNAAEQAQARFLASQQRAAKYARAPAYSESTAGTFGKAASDVGTNASDHGQTAGSFGTSASNVGTNAGGYGKRSDDPSIGTPPSQTAGSYGQTAGSFGQASSTYGQRINGEPVGTSPAPAPARPTTPVRNVQREQIATGITGMLQTELHTPESVRVVSVAEEDLRERLQAVGADAYPDVLLTQKAHPLGEDSGAEVTMLGWPGEMDGGERVFAIPGQESPRAELFLQPTILRKAPHPEQARAFVVWLRRAVEICDGCELQHDPDPGAPGKIAAMAVESTISGGGFGGVADPEAATFNGGVAKSLALMGGGGSVPSALQVKTYVDKLGVIVKGREAVVPVASIVSGDNAFGVVHSVVVLRKDEQKRWKVLQVSTNEGLGRRTFEMTDWRDASRPAKFKDQSDDASVAPKGVTLAAPQDGAVTGPTPFLWWDNLGGAAMQVVEWQHQEEGGAWSDTRLMMLMDREFHVRTQAGASFASQPGTYRWRVWSVASSGAMKLSGWRTFRVVR